MSMKRVLIVGGTGYLGQHLLQSFADTYGSNSLLDLAFTHHSAPPPQPLLDAIPRALPFQVDLRTGNGLDAITSAFGQPDVVINCAAISVPRACEVDPEAAMSINVPSTLVKWLSSFKESDTLLIHLSTDQVYEGTKSFYKEEDETVPVNVYGKSKLEAEHYISANFKNFAILRSSIIYGPQTLSPLSKSLPIQVACCILACGFWVLLIICIHHMLCHLHLLLEKDDPLNVNNKLHNMNCIIYWTLGAYLMESMHLN